MFFTGANEHSIDAKHRLAIPAAVRNQLSSTDGPAVLYINIGPNGALWLWPERTFERMAGDVEPSMTPNPDLHAFDEVNFPLTHRAELDSAGRITIPEAMLADAGLGTKVIVLGMRHHVEVRDPEQWQQRLGVQTPRRQEISERAGAVMKSEQRRTNDVSGGEN